MMVVAVDAGGMPGPGIGSGSAGCHAQGAPGLAPVCPRHGIPRHRAVSAADRGGWRWRCAACLRAWNAAANARRVRPSAVVAAARRAAQRQRRRQSAADLMLLRDLGWNGERIAAALGTRRQGVSRWTRGQTVPGEHWAGRIAALARNASMNQPAREERVVNAARRLAHAIEARHAGRVLADSRALVAAVRDLDAA